MKKFFRLILSLFILVFLAYFSFISYARIINLYGKSNSELKGNKVTFYIISHRWHMGLILPRNDVEKTIDALPFSPSEWLEIGWGDKQYYMNDGFSALGALKALSSSSEGVMHIVAVDNDILENLKHSYNVKEYKINYSAFENMLGYLEESFTEQYLKTPLAPSLYGEGAFFASPLKYHFFYTCNSWISEMMKKAGYKSFPFISQHPIMVNMQLP